MKDRDLQIPELEYERQSRQTAWIFSIVFHLCALLPLVFITCSPTGPAEDLTQIVGWGGSGGIPGVDAPAGLAPKGSPDATSEARQNDRQTQASETERQTETSQPTTDATEPTPSTEQSTNPSKTGDGKESGSDEQRGNPDGTGDEEAGGSGGQTVGNFGVNGFGNRGWIRSPQATAPKGINEVGEVKIRFTVLPSGEVVNVVPLSRATPRLTSLALSAIKRAKARPLPVNAVQESKTYEINYKFVLKR